MRSLSGVVVLCAVLCFEGIAQGYLIDAASCGADTAFVREMVEQAFVMADVTLTAVQAGPMDGYTTFMVESLFNPGYGNARNEIQSTLAAGTNIVGRTTGILSFRQESMANALALPSHEIVIFCNKDRLVPVQRDNDVLFDNVMQDLVGKADACLAAFMYTERFEGKPDAIQICPWFLGYAKAKRYRTMAGLSSVRAALAVIGLDKLITKLIYTPIDLLSLWDKVMFHEMMHTEAGGSKDDVGEFSGYGWKNCKRLSTDPRCYDNADSFAILGSALYWNSQGRQIDVNGKFITPPGAAKRWLGSGAGRGLDAVRLNAVKQFV